MTEKRPRQRPSWKQWMDFSDKGEVFYLYDAGSNVDQISEITGYSPKRLRWLIEGVLGTDTWEEAITAYQEVNNYVANDKGHRDVDTGVGLHRRSRISTRDITKDVCKGTTHRGIGGTRDQVAAHQGAKRPVSRTNSGSNRTKHEHRDRTVSVRSKPRRQAPKGIVDRLREHQDYKGE